jgi:hypothetical protein
MVSSPTRNPTQAELARAGRRVVAYRRSHTVLRQGKIHPLSQVDLAQRAHVSVGCLQAFEGGKRMTHPNRVTAIAEACEMTYEDLLAPDVPAPASSPADCEQLTGEVVAIARMFALADTPVRVAVRRELVTHFSQRTDPVAVALVNSLLSTGSAFAELRKEGHPSPPAASGHRFPPATEPVTAPVSANAK